MPGRRRQPRQPRSRQTVEAIITAAELLLADESACVTTANIAAKAGVSVGSLYEYFSDRTAIEQVVMQRCAKRKLQTLQDVLPQIEKQGVSTAIRKLLEIYVGEVARQQRLTRSLLGRAVYLPADQEPEEVAAAFRGFLRGLLIAWRDQLRPADVEVATFLLVRVLDSAIQAAVLQRPEYLTSPVFVDELASLLIGYLVPGGAAKPMA